MYEKGVLCAVQMFVVKNLTPFRTKGPQTEGGKGRRELVTISMLMMPLPPVAQIKCTVVFCLIAKVDLMTNLFTTRSFVSLTVLDYR